MNLKVGVKVLILNSSGHYLFIKRRDALLDGSGIRWDIPGGRIRSHETLMEGLRREVKEETALHLSEVPKLLDAQDIIVPEVNLHVVRLTYASAATGNLLLSDAHAEHKWASLDEAALLNVDNYARRTLQTLID